MNRFMLDNEIKTILEKMNLKINNKDLFYKYLKIFSINKIIDDYSEPFLNKEMTMFRDCVDTDQVINLIEFDKNISTHILKGILFFENKLKNVVISKWLKFYNLDNPKIYNFSKEELLKLIPNIELCNDLEFNKFRYSLFEHASHSEILSHYSSLTDMPIIELSYSWTLATIINFYRVLDNEIQKDILTELYISPQFHSIFHKMLNVVLKLRNMISHNNVLYNFRFRLYHIEFNKIFFSIKKSNSPIDKYVSIDKICSFIDYVIGMKVCVEALNTEIKKVSLNNYSKEYIIKLIYGLF